MRSISKRHREVQFYNGRQMPLLHLAAFLYTLLLANVAAAQTLTDGSGNEYRELLGLSLKCSAGLWKLGDMVTKREEELVSRNASELRTLEKATRVVGGKNKRSEYTTSYLAYFVDISSVTIDADPPIDMPSGATAVRIICKENKECFRSTDENGSINTSNYHQLFLCDRKTAENAVTALKALGRIAPKPTSREPTGLCTFQQPSGEGMFPSASLGGKPRGDVFLMKGGVVSIVAVSKDPRGREWARVKQQGESIGFVPREYLSCGN